MDKSIRDHEHKIGNLRQLLDEEEKKKFCLEQQINAYKSEIKQLLSAIQDGQSLQESMRAQFDAEIANLKQTMHKEIEINAQQTVRHDLTFDELKVENQQLKFALKHTEHDLDSCRRELSQSVNDKKEIGQEWERKYQYLERIKGNDTDAFNKQLVESRDQVMN